MIDNGVWRDLVRSTQSPDRCPPSTTTAGNARPSSPRLTAAHVATAMREFAKDHLYEDAELLHALCPGLGLHGFDFRHDLLVVGAAVANTFTSADCPMPRWIRESHMLAANEIIVIRNAHPRMFHAPECWPR